MVISAPTGSGKTVLFELCILRLLSRFISAGGIFIHEKGSLKTIYIAPSKALVQEKLRDWNKKFGPLGINCLELTGDSESYTPRNILEADIILTTPEKFDAVSRYGIESGGLSFFSDIALLLIDEVHLLNDPRGAALEAIVSRIKIVSGNPKLKSNPLAQVRFLAVSATIPNIEDLAKWLEVPDQGIKRLLSCLTEHLLAEIVQLTVSDITKAIEWLKFSYLYVRMKTNPMNYAIKKGISGDSLEKHVQDPGRLMTKYYLRFDTMKQIMRTPESCSLEDALHVVCSAEEIAWIQLRRNEKKLLNDINADKDGRLRFHILGDKGRKKKRIQTREEKIFILANDCLTGDPSVHDLSLIQDMNSICSNGFRIAKCMKEYFVYKRNYKGAVNSALLAKSLDQKLWDDSPYLLKQLPGIGMVTAKALHSMGVKSFEALAEADPRRIELVTGRKYPFGNHIKDSLLSLPPKVDVKLAEIENHIEGKSKIVVTLTRKAESGQSVKGHYADMIIGSEDNTILFHEKISPYCATILVPIPQEKQTIKADFIFEEYIGIDVHQKLSLMRESNSIVLLKRNRKQASCPPTEEIYVIEDDNINVPHLPTKELCTLSVDKDSIPSFDLLDESLDEVEDGHSLEVEEEKCKMITEKTVFDHIRQKAKCFSLLSAFDNIRCPSLEVFLSKDNARLKRRNHHHEIVVLDDEDGLEVPQPNGVNLPVELKNAEQDGIRPYLTLNDHHIAGSSNIVDTVVLSLCISCYHCFFLYTEKPTEETVFDHIRRKSNEFARINKIDYLESIIHKTELFSKNNLSSLSAAFGVARETNSLDIDNENMLTSYVKTAAEVCASSIQVELNIYSISKHFSFITSIYILTVSFSMVKEKKRLLEDSGPGSFAVSKKHRCTSREFIEEQSSPSEIRRQCCSIETTGQNEIESYLGFKSVFSFL
ncbi:hypothetical protein LR48_Vigan03g166300 [Vigna angularis]|uniref:DNA 3'-5' helicase n=1 Tax=Phaseolus angularis TaxID=3914 RepID=A0A0L9U685_PHAAN|nr:hypothetical protein LR48_Vigan03g166300 [Vigna angularis]